MASLNDKIAALKNKDVSECEWAMIFMTLGALAALSAVAFFSTF